MTIKQTILTGLLAVTAGAVLAQNEYAEIARLRGLNESVHGIRSMTDGLAHLLGRENQSRGVKVTEAPDGGVNIDLHIAVDHGVNIATVCRSIIGEVRYHVERLTGVDVKNVDVYVESIRA